MRSSAFAFVFVLCAPSFCLGLLNFSSPVGNPLYISANIFFPLNVSLEAVAGTPQNLVSIEMEINQPNSIAVEDSSQFVVAADIACPSTGCSGLITASLGIPLVNCYTRYNETSAIRLFKDHYILPCHKPCWYGSTAVFTSLQNEVLSEFAGVDHFSAVLSRGDFPGSLCLLGTYFRSSATAFAVMQTMLEGLQIISLSNRCSQLQGFLKGKADIGCANIRLSVQMQTPQVSSSLYRDIFFTPTRPNSAPQIFGTVGVTDLQLDTETLLNPLTLIDIDAEYMLVTIMSSGLVRVTQLLDPVVTDGSTYTLPVFNPIFLRGAFNIPSHIIQINATIKQAKNLLIGMRLTATSLGMVSLNITANDMGETGYPAIAPTLQATVSFSFVCKPSIKAPTISIFNSDETFRIDWKPGMSYMKRGNLTTIPNEFFPCGGDVLRGRFNFPKDGTGTGAFGWTGSVPPGDGSSSILQRDCVNYPNTFFTKGLGEKSMYLTLDEGGKARAFIQTKVSASGCQETGEWKVTVAIQNANYSRTDIPIANVSGFHMDWFECQSGAWFCAIRNPLITLDNSTGSLRNLTFWYDQTHRHKGDGIKDYRMTFSGPYAIVQKALSNITVEFPWLDLSYDGSDQIKPWPFQSWPRTGRTFFGSNILRIRVEDVPRDYVYDIQTDRMWTVDGAYRIENLLDAQEAESLCNQDLTCYGFQFLTNRQRSQVFAQQQVPSAGMALSAGQEFLSPGLDFTPGLGFSQRPPFTSGLGWSNWDGTGYLKKIDWSQILSQEDLPNTFFYRLPFKQYDIQPYTINAMIYVKIIKTNICLGGFPYTEKMLDIRLINEPINSPPILTVEKPFWLIQQAYQFPLSGLVVWDEDAFYYNRNLGYNGNYRITLQATRGGFTNPNKNGLHYILGTGTNDSLTQILLCEYRVCQRALKELYYQSADQPGQDNVTVAINDMGYCGELGAQEVSISITLRLSSGPYNIPPTVTIPGLPARVTYLTACPSRKYSSVRTNLSCSLGERVEISGIMANDLDMNQPRWDKLYPEGMMTATITLAMGAFDVTRLKKYGLGQMVLGNPDNSTDTDCPCLVGTSCPCNGYIFTSYCKFSGGLSDVQWAIQNIMVYLFAAGDTRLYVTVNDNCNTGFSDDSGVQLPCLTDTASVVIRVVAREEEVPFLYVSPWTGVDTTRGVFHNGTNTLLFLDKNASSVDNIYIGLTVTVYASGPAQTSAISGYNGSTKALQVNFQNLPSNASGYSINCGTVMLPCQSLQGVIDQSIENSIISAGPGVYSGPLNTHLVLDGRTIEIISQQGYNFTVVDCNNNGSFSTFATTANFRLILDGFSFRNCGSKSGGAMVFRQKGLKKINVVNNAGQDISQCAGNQCLATPVFRHCFFYNNMASSLGGAIYILDGNPVFQDCIFFSNVANAGGAVYVRGGAPFFLRCVFYGNIAETDGGAFLINGGRTLLHYCNFSMNAATSSGGAISILGGMLEMFGCLLTTNYAGIADGGLHASGGEILYLSSFQDGNTAGTHADTLIDDIQKRRQASAFTQAGFQDNYVYRNPFKIHS